jgi:hypothetical protein
MERGSTTEDLNIHMHPRHHAHIGLGLAVVLSRRSNEVVTLFCPQWSAQYYLTFVAMPD